MPLPSVHELSDDDGVPAAFDPGSRAEASSSSAAPLLKRVDALSDDEGVRPRQHSGAGALASASSAPTLSQRKRVGKKFQPNHRIQIGRLLQRPCSCVKRDCLQQFSATAVSDELVDLRKSLGRLDKRDADEKVPGLHNNRII